MKQRELLGFIVAAQNRVASQRSKSKLLVQVGHCSTAIGASELLGELRANAPKEIVVDQSGCDGACFAGRQLYFELLL
jgi:hypothetical protein